MIYLSEILYGFYIAFIDYTSMATLKGRGVTAEKRKGKSTVDPPEVCVMSKRTGDNQYLNEEPPTPTPHLL